MPDQDLLSEIIEFCDRKIPLLDKEGTAYLVIAVYLRQARTIARRIEESSKGVVRG